MVDGDVKGNQVDLKTFFSMWSNISDVGSPVGSNSGNRIMSGLEAIRTKRLYPRRQCYDH